MKDGVAAIYCRVSTEEQARLGQSLSVQLKTLEEYAKDRDYRVFNTYIDEGYSELISRVPTLRVYVRMPTIVGSMS